MGRQRHGKRLGVWYVLAIGLLRPPMLLLTKRDWRGSEHLMSGVRADGSQIGIVVCPNHISWFDPLECAHFLYDNGRPPRYLAKESLFGMPVIGRIVRGAGQIPVVRDSEHAREAADAAVDAVREGECVVVYPEGTITRDPRMWPMKGHTGAARIALATHAPLVPMAMWGAQDVIPPYRKTFRILPRRTMAVRAGSPIDLDDLYDQPLDASVLTAATDRLMAAICTLLEEIRGELAPAIRFDSGAVRGGTGPHVGSR